MNKQAIYEDFIQSREAMFCSDDTIDFYERMIEPFIERFEINSGDVRSFLSERASEVSPSTVHAHARSIQAMVNFAEENGYIENSISVPKPRVPRKAMDVLSVDEIDRVLDHCRLRDKTLVMFLLDSGLRCSEAISLKWTDVDLYEGIVTVRSGKGGKGRKAVIGSKTRKQLLKWDRKCETERIFDLTRSGVMSLMARLSERSGVHITAHKCRRTFATMALRNGMNLFALQRLLGHSSLEMVRRYAQQVTDDLVDAHSKTSPIDYL